MLKQAFESAIDEDYFLPFYHSSDDGSRVRVIRAARNAIAAHNSYVISEVMELIRAHRLGALFYLGDQEDDYSFLFSTMENRPHAFPLIWELVHQSLFEGNRHAYLDRFSAKSLVDELFDNAIRTHQNDAFFTLLQYGLPKVQRAMALAKECDNVEIAQYLGRCIE